MKLSREVKNNISEILDSKEFMFNLYEGLNDKKRQELGQFYTPAKICIEMIEKFNTEDFSNEDILDPCCGSGNLLIAMLIAGADSQRLYGNDYDNDAVKLCRKRINRACDILGKPHIRDWQIHQGNALHEFALTYFDEDYDEMYFDGLKQEAARKRKLDDEKYDAFIDSKAFAKKYKDIHDQKFSQSLSRQAEECGYVGSLFGGSF